MLHSKGCLDPSPSLGSSLNARPPSSTLPARRCSHRCKRRGWPPSAARISQTLSRWPACWLRKERQRHERRMLQRCAAALADWVQPVLSKYVYVYTVFP